MHDGRRLAQRQSASDRSAKRTDSRRGHQGGRQLGHQTGRPVTTDTRRITNAGRGHQVMRVPVLPKQRVARTSLEWRQQKPRSARASLSWSPSTGSNTKPRTCGWLDLPCGCLQRKVCRESEQHGEVGRVPCTFVYLGSCLWRNTDWSPGAQRGTVIHTTPCGMCLCCCSK